MEYMQYQTPSPFVFPSQELMMELDMDLCASKKELESIFVTDPDSVLDLGPYVSPLNSPSGSESSYFSCYSPSTNSLPDDLQQYGTSFDSFHELGELFDSFSPGSSAGSGLSFQEPSPEQQQTQEQLSLFEELLLNEEDHQQLPPDPPPAAEIQTDQAQNITITSESKSLEIVHLLLACVEHIQEGRLESAKHILDHLSSSTTIQGAPLERVSTHITRALSERINKESLFESTGSRTIQSSADAERAFYQHFPFLKFAHFTANRAILESVEGHKRIHVVDLDIGQGFQWPNFIQVLAQASSEVEPPFLRITGVGSNFQELQSTGHRLAEFANLVGMKDFEYNYVYVQSPDELNASLFSVADEEALAVNCSLFLHKLLGNQPALERVMCMIRSWRPSIVTLSEVEANHNSQSFVDRFMEALHFYSAVFDCLESTLPRSDSERLRMESSMFGAQIHNILACEGADRFIRHARADNWRDCMRWSGFKELALSDQALYQAHIFLSLYPSSYTLSREAQALILGWHNTPVVSISTWSC